MSALYEKIVALCDQCGLSVTEMCKQAGVTRSILSEFASGRTKSLSNSTLIKICAFLGVTTDYMTGMIASDNAVCPVCGFRFPIPDDEGATAHSCYHERFKMLCKKYEFVYPEHISDSMIDENEQPVKAKFSKSVLAHGENHPGYEDYLKWLEVAEGDYLYEPNEYAPKPYYSKKSNDMTMLPHDKIRLVPLYESASAGFGAQATDMVVDYMPLFISSDSEADNTMCIKVVGNSMYPKIEDGDIVQVLKTPSVDSGKIAVVLLDGDEGLIKKVFYGSNWVELHSINPEYAPRRFEGAEVQRLRVVGLVKRIIKDC